MADQTELKLPDELQAEGLLVGWSLEHEQSQMPLGFDVGNPDCCPETGFLDAIIFQDAGNLLTFSPQGQASEAHCIIPALLRHKGPVITLNGGACAYHATARTRQEMGDEVVLLDPYGMTGRKGGALNPFALLDPERADLAEKARNVASLICPTVTTDQGSAVISAKAQQFLAAVMLLQVLQEPPAQHNLERTRAVIFDSPGNFQQLLDSLANSPHVQVRRAAAFLALTPPEMMTTLLSYVQEQLQFLNHDGVVAATSGTSFDLDDLAEGAAKSIYIVLPGHEIAAYERLGQLWLGTLMEAIARRIRGPEDNLLMLVDRAQELGRFPLLERANTHMAAIGVHLWTFWSDPEALRATYPIDWRAFLGQAWVIQAFGVNTMLVAQEIAAITGYSKPADIMDLDHDEMLLLLAGDMPIIAQRANGFVDPVFEKRVDREGTNFKAATLLPPKRRPQRQFIRQEPEPTLQPLSSQQLSRLLDLASTPPD